MAVQAIFHQVYGPKVSYYRVAAPMDPVARESAYTTLKRRILEEIVSKANDLDLEGDAEAWLLRTSLVGKADAAIEVLDNTFYKTSKPDSAASSEVLSSSNDDEDDEVDLSLRARCQRCRSDGRGCDRQRPCQRCKAAGIGLDGCIRERDGSVDDIHIPPASFRDEMTKVSRLDRRIEDTYQEDKSQMNPWKCPRCKSEYSALEVLSCVNPEKGLVCEKCGEILEQEPNAPSTAQTVARSDSVEDHTPEGRHPRLHNKTSLFAG